MEAGKSPFLQTGERKQRMRIKIVLFWILILFLYLLSVAVSAGFVWYAQTFDINLENLLYTAALPMGGADLSFLSVAVEESWPNLVAALISCIVPITVALLVSRATIVTTLNFGKKKLRLNINVICRCIALIAVIAQFAGSVLDVLHQMGAGEYISNRERVTTIYEEYYTDPESINISLSGEKKNLLYIIVESMETTYLSEELGGEQRYNLIPGLTELAKENISFSHTAQLGGAAVTTGAGWTMGAIFSQASGIPFSFPVTDNFTETFSYFGKSVVTLGDILAKEGYAQSFLCGSKGQFGGRASFYSIHGEYKILDYEYAIERSYIPKDYMVWWGYEDEKLYDIAKKELLDISLGSQPFNFTMLTVDTHHVDGYVCRLCGNDYGHQLENVISCADRQLCDFIDWCKKQEFYKDTVIVIVGDHYRMDSSLIPENSDRKIYNCFINSQVQPEGGVKNRSFTTLDFFPTILSAMGYEIEGDRLAMGTDLFSDTPSLAEEIGLDYLDMELSAYSQFYIDNFAQ